MVQYSGADGPRLQHGQNPDMAVPYIDTQKYQFPGAIPNNIATQHPTNTYELHDNSFPNYPVSTLSHQTSITPTATSSQPRASLSRFTIPTRTESLSSGFPFDDCLAQLGITQDYWSQFSNEIIKAAKLTHREDYVAWTAGLTTGAVSSSMLLIFGPVVGYYAGKKIHRRTVEKKVQEKMTGDGDLRTILSRWNENVFLERGFQAWLEFPNMNAVGRDGLRVTKTEGRRFRISILLNEVIAQANSTLNSSRNGYGLPGNAAEVLGDQIYMYSELEGRTRQSHTIPSEVEGNSLHRRYPDTNSAEIKYELDGLGVRPSI